MEGFEEQHAQLDCLVHASLLVGECALLLPFGWQGKAFEAVELDLVRLYFAHCGRVTPNSVTYCLSLGFE